MLHKEYFQWEAMLLERLLEIRIQALIHENNKSDIVKP